MANNNNIEKIAIVGAGGIGSYLASFIFDYGVNREQFNFPILESERIDIFDNDLVDSSNLLHQNYKSDDVGSSKAKLLADRYFMNPIERFMRKEDFKNYHTIFSCVDSMSFRKELYNYTFKNPDKLYWIDGRCNSRNIGVFNSCISKNILEKHINNDKERYGCLRSIDKENKISHATPIIVASMMLQVYLNHLRGEDTKEPLLYVI